MERKRGVAVGRAECPHTAMARDNAVTDSLLPDPLTGGVRTLHPTRVLAVANADR